MPLTDSIVQNIVQKLIKSQDYRIGIIGLINVDFLAFAIDFFKQVIEAKLDNQDVTIDWYKKTFLDPKLTSTNIAIHSGLNKKTITNMYRSASKEIVIDASHQHYDILCESISSLVESEPDIDLKLTIKLRGVSVDLNISESLLVINVLAVKRAALRGGLWSSAGKRVEKPLMLTLCHLFDVPSEYFKQENAPSSVREVDFFLSYKEHWYRCEVKLMGKGNPESADAIFARKSHVFIADQLSDLNKQQAEKENIHWVELRAENGYMKFEKILTELEIPHTKYIENIDSKLHAVLEKLKHTC